MEHQKAGLFILIVALICLSGCGTQQLQQFKNPEHMETWTVPLPMQRVYSDYKEYSINKFDIDDAGILIRGGTNVDSDYYGDDKGAVITVRLRTTFYSSPLLRFELAQQNDGTRVNAWCFNNSWRKAFNDYKALEKQ